MSALRASRTALEPFQGLDRGIDGLRPDRPRREGVAAEQDPAGGFLDDPHRPLGIDLRHDQANGAGPHVEDPDQLGRGSGRLHHYCIIPQAYKRR
jgi:hypothetical protein